jgi:Cys-tRNA(Pro)/Cys-tRNA(Cys) deacylase
VAPKKLNSMRLLEQHHVPYEVVTFDDSIHSAEGVAEAVGVSPDEVYKTLVVLPEDPPGSRKPMLVLLSGPRTLDLKKLARATGHKKVCMAAHAEAEKLTGLKVGGISALALTPKNWPVYIDQPAIALSHILISAGQRGVNLRVPVAELVRLLNVAVVECS